MVMLKKGWKLIVALCTVSAMLARMREVWESVLHTETAMEAIAQPPVADTTEMELITSAPATAAAEQAPPPGSMPIGNRFVHGEPQIYRSRFTLQDDNWWMGTPLVLLDMAPRRMPVVYEPQGVHPPRRY
jgi:hypothetical protein